MEAQSITIKLEPNPLAPGRARAAMADLSGQLSEDRLFNLRAVVSELVGNAVKHSATEAIRLRIWHRGDQVWGEVQDGPFGQIVATPEEHDYSTLMVDAFATRVSVRDDASRVWFRLN